nr:MAG TPA: hypothetical protein [Caudoviricetes sp.]
MALLYLQTKRARLSRKKFASKAAGPHLGGFCWLEPVVIDGVLWKPYSVNHIDADGKKFSFYIFAISREHAACVVDDIRETAWLGDEIVG